MHRASLLNSHTKNVPSTASAVVHNYLVCGLYRQGRTLKLSLEAGAGVTSVSTAFTSDSEGQACFTVTTSAAALGAIDLSDTPLL